MSATGGTVALVTSTDRLTCLTAADCAAAARIRDLLGYGTAIVREGTPSAAASNTTSAARGTSLADTDDNAADFTVGTPTPAGAGAEPEPPTVARIREIQGTTRLSPLDGKAVGDVPGVVTAVRTFGSARGFWFQDPAPDGDARPPARASSSSRAARRRPSPWATGCASPARWTSSIPTERRPAPSRSR